MKAKRLIGWAVAALLLGGQGNFGQGFYRLEPNDIQLDASIRNNLAPYATSLRVVISTETFVTFFGQLHPPTSFTSDLSKAVVHPVLLQNDHVEPGDTNQVVAQIFDGFRHIANSDERMIVWGTREQPGSLIGGAFTFSNFYPFEEDFPSYLDRVVFTPKFTRNGATNDLHIGSIHVQPVDHKVVVTGNFTEVNGAPQNGVVRLMTNGVTDPSFRSVFSNAAMITRSKLLSSGSILVAGAFQIAESPDPSQIHRLIELSSTGGFEKSFSGPVSNEVTAIEINTDGSMLVAVSDPPRLLRFKSDRQLDVDQWTSPTIQNGADAAAVHAIRFVHSGSIWIGGDFTTVNGQSSGSFVRLNNDGSLDTSGPSVFVKGTVFDIEGDLIGGTFTNINDAPCAYIARITPTNVLCGAEAIGDQLYNVGRVREILGGGRILVTPEDPLGRGHGRAIFATEPFQSYGYSRTAVTLSGAELYIATVAFPFSQISRFTPTPSLSQNRLYYLEMFEDFLLLRPQHGWKEQFEHSDDLITWELNPEGIRDTNTTGTARFYRIKRQH